VLEQMGACGDIATQTNLLLVTLHRLFSSKNTLLHCVTVLQSSQVLVETQFSFLVYHQSALQFFYFYF